MSVTASSEASTTEGVSQLTAVGVLFAFLDGTGTDSTQTSNDFQDIFYQVDWDAGGGGLTTPMPITQSTFFIMR